MILPKVVIKKILFPTDLSENSIYAFSFAASLAKQYGAGITLLHVMDGSPDRDGLIRTIISDQEFQEIKDHYFTKARDQMIGKKREHVVIKDVLQTFTENVNAASDDAGFATDEILVVRGDPVEEILDTAENRNCDLIVMGSHGRRDLVSVFIGSTAKKVVRQSKKPVLIIRLPE